MSRRTSLATGDEVGRTFGPNSEFFSGWDPSVAQGKNIHSDRLSSSSDSDDSLMQEVRFKQDQFHNLWRSYITDLRPSLTSDPYDNFQAYFGSTLIGSGTLYIDHETLFWVSKDLQSPCTLCWEMSRVKEFHCYLQPEEVPYCSMSFFSDRTDSAIDVFKFNQVCEDELDASLSSQELARFRQALHQVHSRMKGNPKLYLKHLIKSYVLQSKTHTNSAYVKHLRDLVASLSSYQLPNPQTLDPSQTAEIPLIPDRKEQQRILFPYRQTLLATLAIQEELRVNRFKEMGIVVMRSTGADSQGIWRYQDATTHAALSNEEYIQRWQAWRSARASSSFPFEVDLEMELYFKHREEHAATTHPFMTEATSPPAPRRKSNPLNSPPRLRTRLFEEGASSGHSRVMNHDESDVAKSPVQGQSEMSEKEITNLMLCELFKVYMSEMEKRKMKLQDLIG